MKTSEFVYNIAINLGLPLAALTTLFAFRGRGGLKAVKEKFKRPDLDSLPEEVDFWLHGASVGEQMQVARVLGWLKELGVPEDKILISAQTFSGFRCIDHPHRLLMPTDYSWLLKRLCRSVSAGNVLIIETEIWPNFYRYNSGRVFLLNAKMKEKSFPRYRLLAPLVKTTLSHCRAIRARSPEDSERFQYFCSPEVDISAPGGFKWLGLLEDVELENEKVFSVDRPVLVAGSTQPGEEEIVLDLVEEKNCSVYLAPRHLQRIPELKRMLTESDLDWSLWSEAEQNYEGDVIIVDKMGLLAAVYKLGDVAFVGGSWNEDIGGHNLLEPLACGVPVITGPCLHNVSETADELLEAGLLFKAEDKDSWSSVFDKAIASKNSRFSSSLADMRQKAKKIKKEYYDFLERIVKETRFSEKSGGKKT